jgi:hypothetical protein
VSGACGAANGSSVATKPAANLCSAGAASGVSGNGPWNWSCIGINGGRATSCSAVLLQNGACGAANGAASLIAPTNNLCSVGTASAVSGYGPWSWSCTGIDGGQVTACSSNLSTSYPLGATLNTSDVWNTPIQSVFQTQFNQFAAIMHTAPAYIGAAVDLTAPVSAWIGSANGQAVSNANIPSLATLIPVIGFPMYSTASGSPTPDQQFLAFTSGQYDAMIQGVVQAWAQQGFHNQIYRVGWEMNLPGTPYYVGADAQSQADWVNAFRHIYTVLHQAAVSNSVTVQVMWNPGVSSYGVANTLTALYPGNSYVDSIGVDFYADIAPYEDTANPTTYHDWATGAEDTSLAVFINNPVNREHLWTYPAANEYQLDGSVGHALSFLQVLQFAQQQHKPFAIPETGAGNASAGYDVADDPVFPQWLSAQLTTAKAAGLNIALVSMFDDGDYLFTDGTKPQEAAAWSQYFGAAAR